MSLSFDNPLQIGNINAKIEKEIGNLDDLTTSDKSSLVNAINELEPSNGATKSLSNLDDTGNARLHALKSYSDNGEILTDAEGLADVKRYAHSTFDLSKFTVVGSPNITDDGIASGFSSSNYLVPNITSISNIKNFSFECLVNCDVLGTTIGTIIQTRNSGNTVGFQVLKEDSALTLNLLADDGTIICDGGEYGIFISNPVINTNYKLKFEIINGDTLKLYCNDVLVSTRNDFGTKTFEFFTTNTGIGIRKSNSDRPFLGSIDLKQLSITVDGVPVFSGNKTGIDTIKEDNYTKIGTAVTVTNGIASGFSSSSYIQSAKTLDLTQPYRFHIECKTPVSWNDNYESLTGNSSIAIRNFNGVWNVDLGNINISTTHTISLNTDYSLDVVYNGSNYSLYSSGTLLGTATGTPNRTSGVLTYGYFSSGFPRPWGGTIDFNNTYFMQNGVIIDAPILKIPYTESKTGSKIVDAVYRGLVNDMADQFGYANYYTLSDTDFTLPQVELYGLIGQRTLRDSYRNGINYWELYSNIDLEQGGSCTSGVEVTFARPFADTNYVLSVPYSAKSTTAFTPTQTGDWIAKGKGFL